MNDDCKVAGDHMQDVLDEVNSLLKDDKEKEPPKSIKEQEEYTIEYPAGDTPSVGRQRTSSFPYPSTKLRAEAPPFTPECIVAPVEMTPHTFDTKHIDEDCCFVNVDLAEEDLLMSTVEEIVSIIDERIKEVAMTSCSVTSAQSINESLPEIQVLIEKNVNEVVPESSLFPATTEEIASNQYPGRSRFLSRRFTFGNRTQIAALIASIVISAVLIIYVFV